MFSDERAAATSEATGDLTWSAAQARCGMDGGHLVRIDSAEEHEYIQTIPWYASGWIGLWALESGLRWHLPFGHPSIDGMDRIRATAIKALPKVARLEVEGVFYTQGIDADASANRYPRQVHLSESVGR